MVNLTLKDMTHQKTRLILIMIGLLSSVFLIQFGFGIYYGSIREYSKMAKEYDHQVWVTHEDMDMLMAGGDIDDSIFEKIKNIEGVKQADRIIYSDATIEGEKDVEFIYIIGFDLEGDIKPWEDVADNYPELLEEENSIIIDESILNYFPDLKIGDTINLGNRVEFKIVEFSSGALLMGTPYSWCSLETARQLTPWAGNFSTGIGIKLKSGYSIDEFKEDTKNIDGIAVYTSDEIVENTDDFIMNKIGAGMIIYLMAGMGLIVGIIIVAITTYQSVLEKIPMFGTMKALGADKKFINKMMLGQVFLYISISFILGTFLTSLMSISGGFMSVVIDISFSIILYITLLAVSLACAYLSVRKVHKIDPAIVYRR